MANAPELAMVAAGVPHYGDGAAMTGSLIFLVLLAFVAGAAFLRRRR